MKVSVCMCVCWGGGDSGKQRNWNSAISNLLIEIDI